MPVSITGSLHTDYNLQNQINTAQNEIQTLNSEVQVMDDEIQTLNNEVQTLDNGKIDNTYSEIEPASFMTDGLALYASQIWTDGENIYYSRNIGTQRILNRDTNTWSVKTWNEFSDIWGQDIWHDEDHIYYSGGSGKQYELNKETSTWTIKTWNGNTRFHASDTWTDGENIYMNYLENNYVLDRETSTWNIKVWTGLTEFSGSGVWTDGDNIYYSAGTNQYVLNKLTSTWTSKTWTGLTSFSGEDIWIDGENIYYSGNTVQYVLDKSTSTWSSKTWVGLTNIFRNGIWTKDNDVYYSSGDDQYVLNKSTSTWTACSWSGVLSPDGEYIWTDGNNIYFSEGDHYVYDKSSNIWHMVVWNGNSWNIPTSGDQIWTFNGNVYHSGKSILDKTTSTWQTMSWTGYGSFQGMYVWNDGTNCYYSDGATQYVFDFTTSTLNTKTWTGLTNFNGSYVWTDGKNIYYSYESSQYVLDKSTSTWNIKTWNGINSFYASRIWTDGENIFLSEDDNQYILDKATSTWMPKTWTGDGAILSGRNIWTDGKNIYYSFRNNQYKINTKDKIFVGKNGQFTNENITDILDLITAPNAGAHNAIYRGKYLGTYVTLEQWNEINAGTFTGLYIGDYWNINGVNWRIAAFDYWYNTGDTVCDTHHVVIVPDVHLVECSMNNSNVTTGAYVGSNFYTGSNNNTGRATVHSMVNNAFGAEHILSHREYLMNAVTNGYESGENIYDVKIELMNELMVYGSNIFHNIINGANLPSNSTMNKSQLPLFRYRPDLICIRSELHLGWWLRDVASSEYFSCVSSAGDARCTFPTMPYGIRPAFGICQA